MYKEIMILFFISVENSPLWVAYSDLLESRDTIKELFDDKRPKR
jgi:hypothetical protein